MDHYVSSPEQRRGDQRSRLSVARRCCRRPVSLRASLLAFHAPPPRLDPSLSLPTTHSVEGFDRGRRPSKAAAPGQPHNKDQDAGAKFGPLPPGAPDIFATAAAPQQKPPAAAANGSAKGSLGVPAHKQRRAPAGATLYDAAVRQQTAAWQPNKPAVNGNARAGAAAPAAGKRPAAATVAARQPGSKAGAQPAKRVSAQISTTAPTAAPGASRPGGPLALTTATAAAADHGGDSDGDAAPAAERQQRLLRLKERRLANARLAAAEAHAGAAAPVSPHAPGGAVQAPVPAAAQGAQQQQQQQSQQQHAMRMADRVKFFREAPPMSREQRAAWGAAAGGGGGGSPGLAAATPHSPGQEWGGPAAGADAAAQYAWETGSCGDAEEETDGDAAAAAEPPVCTADGIPAGLSAAQYDDLTEKLLERCRKLLSSCGAPAAPAARTAGEAAAAVGGARGPGAAAAAQPLPSPLLSPMQLRLQRLLEGSPYPGGASAAAAAAAQRAALLSSPPQQHSLLAAGAESGLSWRERLVSLGTDG
jgi:hypothetical protein